MINHVGDVFKERNRRIWVINTTLVFTPVAAVKVFSYKKSTRLERRKVKGKRLDDIARDVRTVFNDQIKFGGLSQYVGHDIWFCGIAHHNSNAWVIKTQIATIWVDIAANQCTCVWKVLTPNFQ